MVTLRLLFAAASQPIHLLDIASVTASRLLDIAAITTSRLLAVAAAPNRFANTLPLTFSDCGFQESQRDHTWRNSSSLILCFGLLGRAYLSKGTALPVEVQVHCRRPGWDTVNRLAATLSHFSSPQLASQLAGSLALLSACAVASTLQ